MDQDKPQESFSIEKLIELSGFPDDQCKNIYQYGSRVHGCHDANSDYDFLVIVDGQPFKRLRVQEFPELNVSVSVMHYQFFLEELNACSITLLRLIFLPPQFKLREQISFDKFKPSRANLKQSVVKTSRQVFPLKAKRKWIEGDKRTAMKNIVHGIRHLSFAIQICEQGTVYDWTEGNTYWFELVTGDYRPPIDLFMTTCIGASGPAQPLPSISSECSAWNHMA